MLAARARGAEDVHLDVFVAEVDLDGVVDVGIDEHRGERGVPPRLRVVGRDPHQPVDALLRLQIAVGVLALDLDRDRLDARLFARQQVEHRDLEAVPLRPADVHAHQHLGPVLRLGAAGAGMDGQERVAARRRGPAASPGARRPRRRLLELVRFPRHLGLQRRVRLGLQQLGHLERALQPVMQSVVGRKPVLEGLDLLDRDSCRLGVGPETRHSLPGLERIQALGLARQVKESLGVRLPGAEGR